MTVEAPPGLSRHSGLPVSNGVGPWSPETGVHRIAELPATIDDWSLTQITAGWWLSASTGDVPADVLALAAEPGRPSVVVDADGPGPRTDQLLTELFPALASAGLDAVRLVLPAAADRYAAAASRACGLDIIAAEAAVTITPHGYALVRSTTPAGPGALPQWRRCLPTGRQSAAGVLSPSPAWEDGLTASLTAELGHHATVRRVPAGLALQLPGPDAGFVRAAYAVWPDPERITIVADGAAPHEMLLASLMTLLPRLALADSDGVRLYWPRAGAGAAGPALRELAKRCGADLIAPAANVSASGGSGAVCHGPVGAAPWLQFTQDGGTHVMGSLYPTPAWERALAETDLSGVGGGLVIEHVAAGLCVHRPEAAERGLAATARSVIPDPARATIIASADARTEAIRQDVETVLGRLPAAAARKLCLVLAGAGAGGQGSYAQFLADTFGTRVLAPVGRWTATPDGRLRAFPAATGAGAPGGEAQAWHEFSPRRVPGARELPGAREIPAAQGLPAAVALVDVAPVQRTQPHQPAPAPPEGVAAGPVAGLLAGEAAGPAAGPPEAPGPTEVTGPTAAAGEATSTREAPATIVPLSRDHRSSAQERLLYRESATGYQAHAVAVRRMLTQRPGLRSAGAAESEDALITDFAAVLDFLHDDHHGAAAMLRSAAATDRRQACVLSGLRRLPSFTGAVFSSASLPGAVADGYVTGRILVEPVFVSATSSHLVALEGDIDYVIWSQTGKRVAALAAEAGRDVIIFAAGTAYKVLEIDAATQGAGRIRVFLRELASPSRGGTGRRPPSAGGRERQPPGQLDEMDHKVLGRLVTAAALRDDADADDQVPAWRTGNSTLPIGLDARGVPYLEAAAADA